MMPLKRRKAASGEEIPLNPVQGVLLEDVLTFSNSFSSGYPASLLTESRAPTHSTCDQETETSFGMNMLASSEVLPIAPTTHSTTVVRSSVPSFFQSPTVRAWYRGSSQPVSIAELARGPSEAASVTPFNHVSRQTQREQSESFEDTRFLEHAPHPVASTVPFFQRPEVRAWYSGDSRTVSIPETGRSVQITAPSTGTTAASSSFPSQTRAPSDSESDSDIDEDTLRVNDSVHHGNAVYSEEDLVTMDAENAFVIPSRERLDTIKKDAIGLLAPATEEMEVCCVCELDWQPGDIIKKELTADFAERMAVCLKVPQGRDIPAFIVNAYDASQLDPRLKGLMLYPPGINRDSGALTMQICRSCNEQLMHNKLMKPPSMAIANGNYIGQLPTQFNAMTRTDEQSIALILPCVSLSVVTGGPCRTIKSHHYVVRNTEGPIVEMLPRDLSSHVRIAMVGSMTPTQAIACKKRYEMNVELSRMALHFLDRNNREYMRRQEESTSFSSTSESVPTSVIIDRTRSPDADEEQAAVVETVRDDGTYSSFGSTVLEGVDSTIEDTWIGVSSLLLQSAQHDPSDFVVRKSNEYVPMTSWAVCVKMFPTLFPGGCGGPTEVRAKRLSVRTWILRCLRVHGHRFERHYAFLLLAFDFLALQNARRTLYVKMDIKCQALRTGEVKGSTVLEAVEYFRHMAACQAKGVRPRPPSCEVQRVIDLRKGLRVAESAFYGSNSGRMRARHDLFGMLKRFGPLQVFFTISPDSAGTYNIAVKSGQLSRIAVDEANMMLLPNRAERKAIAAAYPMECARYFARVVNTVIDVLLGWDQEAHAPKHGGGIFGVVRAFGGAAETQRAGDLHCHFVVWLHGFPSTTEEFTDAIQSGEEFRSRLIALADEVLTSKPPCMHDTDEGKCVKCFRDCALEPVVPGVDAFRRPSPGSTAPMTARCRYCGTSFKDKDIMDSVMEMLANQRNVQMNCQWNDYIKCRPPLLDAIDELTTSVVVRDVQVHYWNHCKSCFKKTTRTPKGSVCRFFKPDEVYPGATTLDGEMKLHLHRPIGCEYVNAYNRIAMAVLKCNHDVQFVSISGSKDAASYVSKYCFKSQNPVENAVALSLAAFTKAVRKTNQLPADTTAMERGFRMLGSMLYTVTNGQEVASPMAALYILRESPFWFSHEFVRINLRRLLQKQQESVEVTFSQGTYTASSLTQSNFSTDTALERYWKRQPDLENVPFIDICERYVHVKKAKTTQDLSLPFKPVYYSKSEVTKVLVICGDDIPDITTRLEQLELDFYYKGMLTLFKPHRQSTLFNTAWSPLANYREFVQSGDPDLVCRLQQYETQWKDYFRAKQTDDNEEESEEDILLRKRPPPTNEWSPGHDTDDDTQNSASVYAYEVPDDFLDTTTITAPDASTTTLAHNASALVETIPMLDNAIQAVSGIYNSTNSVSPPPGFDYSDYRSLVVSSEVSVNDEGRLGTDNFIALFREASTRLERLKECFGPVPYRELDGLPRYTADTLPSFPSIEVVSEAFQLNFWQHVAFENAARHLLYAYSQDIADALSEPLLPLEANASPCELKLQLIGYLGGEAGTGKSTVVDALLRFASRWGREGSVETLAFTGAAAINIKGRTMHSARNLKINGAEPNAAPTTEMKSKFSQVILVAIDEISITDQALLGGTDSVSRALSSKPQAFMGGRHTLLIGDQHQLPPIAGSPCFKPPPATANRLRHAGYELYNAINFVVFLTKNMRARFDEDYTQILADLRWGRVSDKQLASLNTRVQTGDLLQAPISEDHDEFYRPVIVCTNKLRCAINLDFTFRVAKAHELPVYECLAVPSSRSRKIADHLANVNDDLTDRVPMKLLFFVGMPVMLTRKHPLLLEAGIIANGVLGTVVGTYPVPEELPMIRYEIDAVVVHKLLRLPKLLLIKLHGCHNTLVSGFAEGVIGLPPLHGSLRLSRIPNLSQASITVDQFAAVPAFACTTEKLQGQTCHDGVIVTPLDRRRGVPTQTLYVALSRAVSLAGLTLTEPITREYLAKFKPTKETTDEIHRLVQLVRLPPYAPAAEIQAFIKWKTSQSLTS